MLSRVCGKRAFAPLLVMAPFVRTPFRHTATAAADSEEKVDPRERPMKRPILRGRKWTKDDKRPGYIDPEELPNPFRGKGLPFGRRVMFTNLQEEELARGAYWHENVDRFSTCYEFDMLERGWGNEDFYKMPGYKRPFDDITQPHNIDYHYLINNLELHLYMVRHVPHLAPLYPELKQDFDALTKKWQDIVEETIGDHFDLSSTTESEQVKEYEEVRVDHEGRTEKVTTKVTKEVVRKFEVKRDITKRAIKQFVDDVVEDRDFVRLIFIDALGTKYYVYGMVGETLLQCCRRYAIHIDGYCNGYDRGHIRVYGMGAWCSLCQMDISPKYFHLMPPFDWQERFQSLRFRTITPTSRLGCCIWIRPEFDGMVVSIPVTLAQPYGLKDESPMSFSKGN